MTSIHEHVIKGDHWYQRGVSVTAPIFDRGYKYYDTPDGHDLAKKLFYINSFTAKFGAAFGYMYTAGELNEPKSRMEWAARIFHHTKPFIAVPTLSIVAIHFLTKYREVDDSVNYFFGCFFGGQYIGRYLGNPYLGLGSSFVFAVWAMLTKYAHDRDMRTVFSGPSIGSFEVQSLRSLKSMDFTRYPEKPRNWYTAEEVKEQNIKLPEGKPGFIIF